MPVCVCVTWLGVSLGVCVYSCAVRNREKNMTEMVKECVSVCVLWLLVVMEVLVWLPVMQLTALIQTPTSAGHPAASASLINTTDKDRLLLGCEEEWYGASNRMSVCACVCVCFLHIRWLEYPLKGNVADVMQTFKVSVPTH